jgi:integrase
MILSLKATNLRDCDHHPVPIAPWNARIKGDFKMYDLKWSHAEKTIARRAFDKALSNELEDVIREAKSRADEIKDAPGLWALESWLTERRQEIDRRYDYRYSILPLVFANLLRDGKLPKQGALALRDRTLFMVLYNTGARVQEVADLSVADVDLDGPLRVRLHGKGDKWRSCPLWPETAELLKKLMGGGHVNQPGPLFMSRQRKPLTRFGIYKIVKRHTSGLCFHLADRKRNGISPHVMRHSTAVGLLEQGVEVNVIRAWLGHVSLDTTNRYAEITLRTKQTAVAACFPPVETSEALRPNSGWRKDEELMKWLSSL